jgi:cytochrome c551/c552
MNRPDCNQCHQPDTNTLSHAELGCNLANQISQAGMIMHQRKQAIVDARQREIRRASRRTDQ